MKRSRILMAMAYAALAHNGHTEDIPHTNASPILVELFTSEGCSSCPPVDAFLQQIDASQPIPGAQVIVLSEHVDYWDHDGWKDPYSQHLWTERQSTYARALGISQVYTPQIVVDGAAELRANAAHQILQQAAAAPKIHVRIGPVSIDSKKSPMLQTHIETDATTEKRGADIYVAVALDHAESDVLHGENGGRRLKHVAVVQSITRIGKIEKGKSFSRDFQEKLSPSVDPGNLRIVAFVQKAGPGRVLGAAMQKYSPQ
jgi:hypothetical protein